MTNVNTAFLAVLDMEVKKNPQLKNLFNEMKLSRLFDDMPCWLEESTINNFSYQYKMILLNMKRVNQTDEGFVISEGQDKKFVENFEKTIINAACDDLLDQQGNVKQEILDLFDCKKSLSHTNVYCLVSAYVSGVNQELYKQSEATSENYIQSVNGFYAHFKANYSTWIVDAVRKRNKNFTVENVKSVEEENFCDKFFDGKIDKKVVIGTGVGVALLSGLAVAGLLLFKALAGKSSDTDSVHANQFRNRN